MSSIKISEQQARDYALLIKPLIRQYIISHQEEYEAFCRAEDEKEAAKRGEVNNGH